MMDSPRGEFSSFGGRTALSFVGAQGLDLARDELGDFGVSSFEALERG